VLVKADYVLSIKLVRQRRIAQTLRPKATRMRHFVFALTIFLSAATVAEAATIALLPGSSNNVILAQSTQDDSPNYYSGNSRDRQRRARFVCVITPPESANRRRPYVCPIEQGRVGGSCRCSGVVGNGTIDTAW
jgi:hypothetical protein